MAMHWGDEFLSGSRQHRRTPGRRERPDHIDLCPTSKQPEFKHVAIKVLKAELPWSLLGMAWLPDDRALAAREAAQGLDAAVSVCQLHAVCAARAQWAAVSRRRVRGAARRVAAQHRASAGPGRRNVLRYADPKKRGQRRAMQLTRAPHADGTPGTGPLTLNAFVLGGDTRAQNWIKTLLQDELPAQAYGRMLLSPSAKAPLAVQSRGKQVCTCFNVTDTAITTRLGQCRGYADERLAQLQSALQCGTNCGSCLPEVKRLVRQLDGGQPLATLC